jgi:hypothetical protein
LCEFLRGIALDELSVAVEASLHRDVYIATLRSALNGWLRREDFADRIDCTRVYLQYLLSENGTRTPGPETAERIANMLPLPPAQRVDLLDHMLLAGESRLRAWRHERASLADASPAETLERMRAAHWTATYAEDPGEARPQYETLRDLTMAFLRDDGLRQHPLLFVETCLLLHDTQSVLDRPGDALFHARRANLVMRRLDAADYPRGRERFEHLRVNTAYAEAVTLTTLGLPRQAEASLQEAEAAVARNSPAATFWLPHILRHHVAALSMRSRFSQYELRETARRAHAACEARADPLDAQVSLLIDASLARGYLQCGTALAARKAANLLRPAVETIDRVPYLGPVHRTVVLSAYARACWTLNRRDEWDHYLHHALTTAAEAGLERETRKLRLEYGNEVSASPRRNGKDFPSPIAI